jgi:hypothetical protein
VAKVSESLFVNQKYPYLPKKWDKSLCATKQDKILLSTAGNLATKHANAYEPQLRIRT